MDNIEKFVLEHSEFELPPDELAHHGIAGMKWGVQNGPPYPLDSKTHNSVVKKASNAVSSAGSAVKKTVRKIEDNVAKSKETKAKEKLESEKRKLKLEKVKAKTAAVKEEREALKKKEKEAKEAKAAEKKAAKEQKRAEKQAVKDEKLAKTKADAIAKGDLKYISKNHKNFTDQEIAEAIARKSLITKLDELGNPNQSSVSNQNQNGKQSVQQKLDNYAKKPVADRAQDMVDKAGKWINTGKKVADYATTGISVYNTIADIANANGGSMKKIASKPADVRTEEYKTDGVLTKTVTYKNDKKVSEERFTNGGSTPINNSPKIKNGTIINTKSSSGSNNIDYSKLLVSDVSKNDEIFNSVAQSVLEELMKKKV